MKIKSVILISILMICVVLTSCQKTIKADTTAKAGLLMKQAIDANDYEMFNALFSDGRKGTISRDKFNEMKKITTSGTGFTHYELLTFGNGEMMLVMLTAEKIKGEYKIEDVFIVPSEMEEIFNNAK